MNTDSMVISIQETDRIIEMAWEDRTPFEAIKAQFGLSEKDVIVLMRRELSMKSWKRWRKHVQGRVTKHAKCRNFAMGVESVHKSRMQRNITLNKISKR
jgi:uncharacterized protein (TIGR03643 family)